MTTRVQGFRWHRRAVDDWGVDFSERLAAGETLVDTPATPSIEIVRKNTDGTVTDVLAEFGITQIGQDGQTVTWRKGAAATGEQDAGPDYEVLVLVYTSTGRKLASSHPLEVVETGDPTAP